MEIEHFIVIVVCVHIQIEKGKQGKEELSVSAV